MELEQLIIVVFMLMTLIQMFWIKNSIPVEHVEKLLNKAEAIADETPSEVDNQVIALAKNFWGWYQSRNEDAETDLNATAPIPVGEIEADIEAEQLKKSSES